MTNCQNFLVGPRTNGRRNSAFGRAIDWSHMIELSCSVSETGQTIGIGLVRKFKSFITELSRVKEQSQVVWMSRNLGNRNWDNIKSMTPN